MNFTTNKSLIYFFLYSNLIPLAIIWCTCAQVGCSDYYDDFGDITNNELEVEEPKKYFFETCGTKALFLLKILDRRLKKAYNSSVRKKLYFYPLLWNMSHRFVRKLSNETKDWMKRLRSEKLPKHGNDTKVWDDWDKHLNKVDYTLNEMNLVLDKFCDKYNIVDCHY